jgi:uncharacterized protein with GYD domain
VLLIASSQKGAAMPKYMFIANYTPEGVNGVLSAGGSARRTAVAETVKAMGGSLESFYFGFGSDDAYVVVDLPDNATAAALALQVGASGMTSIRTVVLMSPEDVDGAAKMPNRYRPPGS